MAARTANTSAIEREIRAFAEKSERILSACLQRMTPAQRALTEKKVEAFWKQLEQRPTKGDILADAAREVWKRRKKSNKG